MNMTRKNRKSLIFNVDVIRGRLEFESEFAAGHDEYRRKYTGSHFGVISEKGLHTRCELWRGNQWTSMLELQQKLRKQSQGMSVPSFSLRHVVLFVQLNRLTQFSYAFLFPGDVLKV